jgi:hypothetical protein
MIMHPASWNGMRIQVSNILPVCFKLINFVFQISFRPKEYRLSSHLTLSRHIIYFICHIASKQFVLKCFVVLLPVLQELTVEERDGRFPFPAQEHFSILLFSPVSWEVNPRQTIIVGREALHNMQHEDWHR